MKKRTNLLIIILLPISIGLFFGDFISYTVYSTTTVGWSTAQESVYDLICSNNDYELLVVSIFIYTATLFCDLIIPKIFWLDAKTYFYRFLFDFMNIVSIAFSIFMIIYFS